MQHVGSMTLNSKWTEANDLVIIILLIDHNLVVGSKVAMLEARKDMMARFACMTVARSRSVLDTKSFRMGGN